MTKQYENHYRILGILPGTSWKLLRKSYKSLVNKWHPDRFQQDLRQRKTAEEKTKEITQAYKEIAEYYKKYDSLPLPAEDIANLGLKTSEPQPSPVEQPSPDDLASHYTQTARSPEAGRENWFTKYRVRIFTAAGLICALLLLLPEPPESEDQSFVNQENPSLTAGTIKQESPSVQATDNKYFTIGSTIGEVYAIQGVPTRTEENIWYYGKSKVLFSNGKVSGWEEGSDTFLRINIVPKNNDPTSAYFHIGSMKQEVLAVQGLPDRDSGSVWDYGASRIYFENDRVSDWHEAPFDRLKARR
ncbi:MAG: J domain-containing protein [Gammaproteobacteria bacterium]|nr:J domain-containing protein [Gammaproteobacteria bacterium]